MKKTIKLIDLDCGHCAAKIQSAVKKIDGVTDVSVNFMNQKMVLEAPDDKIDAISGATITTNAVTNAVDSALIYYQTELGGGINE